MAETDELTIDLLPDSVTRSEKPQAGSRIRGVDLETLTYEVVQQGLATAGPEEDSLHTKIVSRIERELIAQVMLACSNVQTKAASKLGINRNTLHKKLKEYDLES
jgi:DNA-binding protein Fis